MLFGRKKREMPTVDTALPGRDEIMAVQAAHLITGNPLEGPFADQLESIVFGMGCFWGVERVFWTVEGVHTTAVGYAGGITPNPTYREVCSGRTGHNEVVLVVFDPAIISQATILKTFWENHDPTQGMRQGNDVGTQYRSGIYTTSPQQHVDALASRDTFAPVLAAAGYKDISTEILSLAKGAFYYAEEYHQQYLHRNPGGYCGIGGTGQSCPIGVAG